jgi:hypothetical protein
MAVCWYSNDHQCFIIQLAHTQVISGKRPELPHSHSFALLSPAASTALPTQPPSGTPRLVQHASLTSPLTSSQLCGQTAGPLAATTELQGQQLNRSTCDVAGLLNNSRPARPLACVPATVDALPELNALIAACWNHRDLRRPTAAALHAALDALLMSNGGRSCRAV